MVVSIIHAVVLCTIGTAAVTNAYAQSANYEGRTISRIRFEPPSQPLPEKELIDLIPLKAGEPFRSEAVRESIARLYDTGRFQDIAVEALQDDDGLTLRIITEGSWFVGRVRVEGVSEPPNQGQLVASTKLQLGAPLHPDDAEAAVKHLTALLESNGYFEADILPELHHDTATQQVHFDFRIRPGPRARYARPILVGAAEGDIMRLVNATRWKRLWGLLGWRSVAASRTAQGLERMQDYYRDRHHLLARVDLEQMDYTKDTQRATPRVAAAPGPKVEIQVEGADLSTGRLRQLVPIEREQSADMDLLREGQQNIEEYFQEQGYFRAKVDFETRDEPGGRRVVIYTVDRGRRYRLRLLEITGNEYFDLATLRERMNVMPVTTFRFRQGRFSDALLRSDINSIRELYLSNGFLKVDISDPGVVENYEGQENDLAVYLKIVEGPQTLVGDVEIGGLSTEHEAEVRSLLAAIKGQPFSETLVASDRDMVLNHYYNRGYPDASFQWSMSQRGSNGVVDLRYQVEEGRRVYVRGVLVGGLQTSDPEMVQSRIPLNQGNPLSQLQLIESQRRMYDLGVFARVDVAVQNPEGQERSKYVLYQVEEARKYSFNMGIGAEVARIGRGDTLNAPAGEPGFSPRVSLGVSRSNMFGVGHTVSVQTRLSSIQQRALITYLAPRFKGYENVSLTITGMTDLSRDSNTFTVRRQEGSVQIGQRLSRANQLQYRFAYRRVAIDEGSLRIDPDLIPVLAQNVRVGILSGTYIQDRRDDPIESRRGYLNSIDIGIASKAFASQTDYLRVLARNSTYHRLAGELILARSLTLGWQKNVGSGGAAAIPLAERFFSGGGASHRGFPDNQAGPRDLETGFPIGGSALLVNNLELRFPLLGDTVGGVAFHDAGNVYARFRNVSFRPRQNGLDDFNYMVHAVGFGIRYRTPIGPLRLDLAYAPNSPRFVGFRGTFQDLVENRGEPVTQRISRFQFHFSLGQTF